MFLQCKLWGGDIQSPNERQEINPTLRSSIIKIFSNKMRTVPPADDTVALQLTHQFVDSYRSYQERVGQAVSQYREFIF